MTEKDPRNGSPMDLDRTYVRPRPQIPSGLNPTLHGEVPPAQAMLAFKQFAAREDENNMSLLVGVPLSGSLFEPVKAALEKHGYRVLPVYGHQDPHQRALLRYVAEAWKESSRRVCCGVRNVSAKDGEDKIGSLSGSGRGVDDPHFEPFVAGLREELRKKFPKAALHYACLPPLDLDKVSAGEEPEHAEDQPRDQPVSLNAQLTAEWIRITCREKAYAAWVAKHWPEGTTLRKILNATYYADWLLSLLANSLYPSYTEAGKRQLVRFALLAAQRARRWTPSKQTDALFAATMRWFKDPSEANREALGKTLAEFPPGNSRELDKALQYADQAATDAVVQAARAAESNDPRSIAKCVGKAAIGSVMASTFASEAPQENTWLQKVNAYAVPDELAEHCGLCVSFRNRTLKLNEKPPDPGVREEDADL